MQQSLNKSYTEFLEGKRFIVQEKINGTWIDTDVESTSYNDIQIERDCMSFENPASEFKVKEIENEG